jgi:hypothetical protein
MATGAMRPSQPPAAVTALGEPGSITQWRAVSNSGVRGLRSRKSRKVSGTASIG